MSTSPNKKVIVIVGPTAVGKTAVAIDVARHYGTEIISADSRQCFRELRIGVARPSDEELHLVRHHFIASHSIHQEVNAGTFEEYALRKAKELFATHDTIVMTGGTGLYIKAFCEGLDEIPEVDADIRAGIISDYEEQGLPWLQQRVQEMDPLFYDKAEIQNPQRLMRALEVITSTGRSVLEYRTGNKAKRDFDIIRIGLELRKEQLHQNINDRVERMFDYGLVDEVRELIAFRDLNALRTVGYSEVFDMLDGSTTLEEAKQQIKVNTRHYAKRQMTWFRKDKEVKWFSSPETMDMITYVEKGND
ncbi:MAG: tRNA (adenosine(37)-N6)-dimethylallyltransferase MiaA [Chitinophagaceae bacterium]|nr:tRNA (adenosine(37)-N6)-dimethylallyltransferase MiaA [Chitinophagaceae bacterium]